MFSQGMSNDELVLAPGDYGSAATPLSTAVTNTTGVDMNIHGTPGARARIFVNDAASPGLYMQNVPQTLRDVEVVQSANQVALQVSGTLERVSGRSVAAPGGAGCSFAFDVTVIDSVCASTSSSALAAGGSISSPFVSDVVLRNVTAISNTGAAMNFQAGTNNTLNVTAVNVIARGGTFDILAENTGGTGPTVNIGYSNYRNVSTSGVGPSVNESPAGSNQTGMNQMPAFVNDAGGDYHQAPGSPTIDAGITDPANGMFDLDGMARAQGASTDIGAFEFAPASTGGGAGTGGGGGSGGGGGGGGQGPTATGTGGQGGDAGPCGGGGAGGGGAAAGGGGHGGGGCFNVVGVQRLAAGAVSATAGVATNNTTIRAEALVDMGRSGKARASRLQVVGTKVMRGLQVGRYKVTVRLSAKARRRLKQMRKPRVLLRLRMTAPTGRPLVVTRTIRLKR